MKFLLVALLLIAASPAYAAFEDKPIATLRWLNKITAQTEMIDVPIGETIHHGDLSVRVRSCRKQDPLEGADASAFLQIWEKDENGDPQWVFSGWMFSGSPGLSAMDHPIYDVWPLDCSDGGSKTANDDDRRVSESDAQKAEEKKEEPAAEEETAEATAEEAEADPAAEVQEDVGMESVSENSGPDAQSVTETP